MAEQPLRRQTARLSPCFLPWVSLILHHFTLQVTTSDRRPQPQNHKDRRGASHSACNRRHPLALGSLVSADFTVDFLHDESYTVVEAREPPYSGTKSVPDGTACPLQGDVASGGCHPNLSSYDVECARINEEGRWACIYSNERQLMEDAAGVSTFVSVTKKPCASSNPPLSATPVKKSTNAKKNHNAQKLKLHEEIERADEIAVTTAFLHTRPTLYLRILYLSQLAVDAAIRNKYTLEYLSSLIVETQNPFLQSDINL